MSGEAAAVKVDPQTGAWSIVGTFKLPGVFGNPYNFSPSYSFDHVNKKLYLQYQNDLGYTAVIDLQSGKWLDGFQHHDPFFVGFTSFAVDHQAQKLIGTSPSGALDGTFSFGELDLATRGYKNESLLRFKALMDDSHLLDQSTNTYYCQADYDQRKRGLCRGGETLCLLDIDSTNGNVRDIQVANYTIYKYSKQTNPPHMLAFVEGSEGHCKVTQNGGDFLFGTVDLSTGKMVPKTCLASNLVLQEDEWIGAFTSDDKYFATGSRFAQTTQLIVFDVETGKEALSTSLPGLAKALKTADGFYWIWAMEFA